MVESRRDSSRDDYDLFAGSMKTAAADKMSLELLETTLSQPDKRVQALGFANKPRQDQDSDCALFVTVLTELVLADDNKNDPAPAKPDAPAKTNQADFLKRVEDSKEVKKWEEVLKGQNGEY